jgi:hypothetical protein
MEDPRLTKCLAAQRESRGIEFKEKFDPADTGQCVELLKDIVAICNSGGGTLAIGINDAGEASGADIKPILAYDHSKYCNLVKKYTMQDFCDFEVIKGQKDGQAVAIFLIDPPDSPLVFEKPGTYVVDGSQQKTAFSKGTVYFRHGAKSEPGTTEDLRKFMQQRVREMEEQLVKGLKKVSVAPRGSQLQVVPRGTVVTGESAAVRVRMTTDPNTKGVIAVDRDQIFPYRQKDLVERLKKVLPSGSGPGTYDLQAINKVYNIAAEENLSWQPQFSSRQYSEAFVEWIVDRISNNKGFLQETRGHYYQMNRKTNKATTTFN